VTDERRNSEEISDSPVVLFDGVCNLCIGSIQWLLRMDRRGELQFGTLQSEAGEKLLTRCGLPEGYDESMVVVEGTHAYTGSNAALRVARHLGLPWSLAWVGTILPRRFRDRIYQFVANNRYDWFGKREQCLVPDEELRARFID
jgi:predicted DCC family thiol-disulfide oxidoreductase YuxK